MSDNSKDIQSFRKLDFDFSAEVPEFREQLYQKLLQQTHQDNIVLLFDDDLIDVNAAGTLPPTKPNH